MSKFQHDLTQGSVTKQLLLFSLPFLASNLLQALYNLADMLIVGRFCGPVGASAVGLGGQVTILVINLISGLAVGGTVLIAQYIGAKRQEEVAKTVGTMFTLYGICGAVITVVMLLCSRYILIALNTSPEAFDETLAYLNICMGGTIFVVGYNAVSAVLRGMGDSKHPLLFVAIAAAVNVVLDILFVAGFHMGVAGAAYATVIAQVGSGLLCLLYMLRRYPILKLRRDDWRLRKSWCVQHLKLGLPMALQFSITAVGIMVLQKALNSFGSNTIAAYTAASKVEQLATQPLQTLGITMATYCGQNLGAGRIDRIRRGVVRSVQICVVCCLACGLLVVFGGRFFVGLFLEGDQPAVVEQAQQYLNTIAGFLIVLGLLFIFRNALQGMGSTLVPMLAGAAELVVRVLVAFLLPAVMGYAAICIAGPAAWVGATIPLIVCYLLLMRRLRSVRPEKKPEETAP